MNKLVLLGKPLEKSSIMPRPKNNLLRTFFQVNKDGQAICSNGNCNQKVLTTHCGNLERHLKSCHKTIYASYMKRKDHECLKKTKDDSIVKFSSTVSKKNIDNALVDLFTKCGRPLHLAEDPTFRILTKPVLDELNITLNENNVIKRIAQFSNKVKAEISDEIKGKLISLKLDSVSRLSLNFLGLSAHYVKNDSIAVKTLAIKQTEPQDSTSCHLQSIITEVLVDYSIDLKQVVTIITDNAVNMIEPLNDFDDEMHTIDDYIFLDADFSMENITCTHCGAHIIQLCVTDVMKMNTIKENLCKLRAVAKELRTETYLSMMKSGNYEMPLLDNSARWNSTCLMLGRLINLRDFIDKVKLSNEALDISDEIWTFADEFLKVFKYVYEVSRKFQSEDLIYSDLYIQITSLILHLENLPNSDINSYLLKSLHKRKSQLFDNDLFTTAIFLDPRVKVCLTLNQIAKAKRCILQLHSRLMSVKGDDLVTPTPFIKKEKSISPSPPSSPKSSTVEELFENYMRTFENTDNKDNTYTSYDIENDLLIYGQQCRLGMEENILEYWTKRNNTLTTVAHVVLGIPCTQASIEQLVSALKYISADQPNNLDAKNLEHILLVRASGQFDYE